MRTDTFTVGAITIHLRELDGHGWLAQQYATGLVARGVEDTGQRFALLNVINLLCQTTQVDGLDVSPAYALTSLDSLQAAAAAVLGQPKALIETWSSRVYLLNQHNDAELQPPGDVPPLSDAPQE
jgi:hypothetical protein